MAGRGAAATLGAAWGAALVSRPDALVEQVAGRRPDEVERLVARVLGVRQGLQAAAVARWPRRAGRLGAVTDGLHAASMVALAVASPRYRRVAATSAGVAVLIGLLELRGARA